MTTISASLLPLQRALPRNLPRTLLVDDQPDVLAALRMLLKGEGFETESVNSPDAVIRALATDDFDLVVMDLNYTRDTTSGAEGLDLISRIRSLNSTIPVVAMTAWGNIELAVEAMSRGVCDFVTKPWENARLVDTLRKHLQRGRELREAKRDDVRELAEAREIQQSLLPRVLPRVPGIEIATDWQPARAVGGDSYDVIKFGESRMAFTIGDVMGKGLPAALLMANAQSSVRSIASAIIEPQELCAEINRIIHRDICGRRFITFFYGVIDTENARLRYANAGHNPPMLVRRGGRIERLEAGGAVLGAFPDQRYESGEVVLEHGDRLLLFTDGITEAIGETGQEFGEDRLQILLSENRASSADALRDEVMRRVREFTGGSFQDDATLMVISVI